MWWNKKANCLPTVQLNISRDKSLKEELRGYARQKWSEEVNSITKRLVDIARMKSKEGLLKIEEVSFESIGCNKILIPKNMLMLSQDCVLTFVKEDLAKQGITMTYALGFNKVHLYW